MKKVDLHLHSYASDGEWSAEQLLEALDQNDVKVFAVTDHDDLRCIPDMAFLMKDRPDMTYIKGVEGTVSYRGIEHHILTYFIDEEEPKLQEVLAKNRKVRDDANDHLMAWLHEKYPQVSPEAYNDYIYDPFQGGWRAFGYLMDNKVIKSLGDYFSKTKGFVHEKIFVSPEEYLPRMKALGYKTVLAHPPAYVDGDIYEEEHLDYFRELGLDGIECYSQYLRDQKNAQYYVDYCNKHDMLITGGSDCHGGFAGRRIGHPEVDESMIRLFHHEGTK